MGNVVNLRGRTPEQIRAQLEARCAEIERELKQPHRQWPCATCKWSYRGHWCRQPLVWGPRDDSWGVHYSNEHCQPSSVPLCGPEKALWEPQRWWQAYRRSLCVAAIICAVAAYVGFLFWVIHP